MSDVPEGYRMSEVGIIPEGWDVVNYGDNLNIISGMGFNKSEYVDYGIKLLRIDNVSYGEIIWESIAFLPMNYKNKYKNLIINNNDILLALNRPITNGKLKIAIVEPKDIPCILYQRVGKIVFLNNLYDRKFAYYLLSKFIKKFVEESSVGSDQPFISTTKLKQIKIPLPPLPEQQAIASALSDVDALITALGQLITKKRNIKQGAMQQLLTGEKRLPGFEGEWEEMELADFGTFRGGSGFPTKYQGQLEGEYPFYKVSDMNNKGNEVFMSTSNNYISESVRKLNAAIIFPKDAIVFAKIGAAIFLERKKILSQDSCIDNNMMGFIMDHSKCNTYFIYSLFHSLKLGKLVTTTALPSLSGNEIGKLRIKFPSLPEQQAIAQILSDMDAEIEALEQKQAKYKAIKQGIMQELLTGKTRLV